jgi:Haem-degrading
MRRVLFGSFVAALMAALFVSLPGSVKSLSALAPRVNCSNLPDEADLKGWLAAAAAIPNAGGLFDGARMWAAVVNRDGEVCAFFGGGVALYRDGSIIGGLGVSGDTSCTDHEIAKRVRNLANLNPPGGQFADDIQYTVADGASVFTHPLCVNTWRNGVFIGQEPPATGY